MKPRVIFPDPRLVALGILRSFQPTIKAGTIDPEQRDKDKQGLPYTKVSVDGGTGQYPVTSNARVRVSVWAASDKDAVDKAQLYRAVLESFPGDASVRSLGNSNAPLPATDPDNARPMAFFSIDIRLRPIPF